MWDSRSPSATYTVQQLVPNYFTPYYAHKSPHRSTTSPHAQCICHVSFLCILSSSKTLWRQIKTKTNLTTTFSKMMAGWIVDWLNEYPPPTRGYWKIKPNHNTMKPWRPGEAVIQHKNYKTLDIFIWDSLTLNIREFCYTERFDSSERGQPSVKYRLVYT